MVDAYSICNLNFAAFHEKRKENSPNSSTSLPICVCRCEPQASSKSMIASLTVANFSFHRKDYKNMYVRFLERRPYDDGSEIIGINHLVIFHSMRWSLIIMFIKSAHSCSECLLQSDLKSWIDCKTHQCFRKSKHHPAFFWIFSIIIIGSDGFRSWISRSKKEV